MGPNKCYYGPTQLMLDHGRLTHLPFSFCLWPLPHPLTTVFLFLPWESCSCNYVLYSCSFWATVSGSWASHPIYLIWSLVTGIPTGPTGGSECVPRDEAGQRWCTHLWCRLEDMELLGIGQGGVQRQDQHGGAAIWEVLCNVSAGLAHGFNFLLASEEHQDILWGRGFLYKSESGIIRL